TATLLPSVCAPSYFNNPDTRSIHTLSLHDALPISEQGQSIGGLLCYHLRIHLKQLLSWSFHRPTFSQHHLIHLFLLEVFHRLFYLPVLCEVRRDVYSDWSFQFR